MSNCYIICLNYISITFLYSFTR